MRKNIILMAVWLACYTSNTFAFTTLGVPTCSEWNETRAKTNYGKNLNVDMQVLVAELSNQSFVIGYINAYATHFSLSQNSDILKSTTKEKILEMIDDECGKNPNQDVGLSSFRAAMKRLIGK